MLTDVANVAVTTDIWTSDSNKAYISVTIHFIYNDQMVSRNIATKELEDVHHTGENIARALDSIFQEWNINNKIVTVVSDNGANIKNDIRQMNVHHHPCIAHTLNLTVTESLDNIPLLNTVIKKCRSLFGHFKHSVVASQIIKEMQIQMNLPILKVKQYVRTRWNSCLIMMEILLKIKAPLSAAITSIPQAPEFLDTAEWQIIADCVPLLKPIEDITTVLSGEKYPTHSMVPPLIRGLQVSLKNKVVTVDVANQLKTYLLDSISRRLGNLECNKIVAKATLLDPRFKKLAFGVSGNANNAQTLVHEELVSIVSVQSEEEIPSASADTSTSTMEAETSDSIWTFLDDQVKHSKSHITPNVTGTMMLRQYLELPYLSRSSNPLEFWKSHSGIFPDLYRLQAKYLCIPATSVPSERVFLKGRTINE
ncbi:hypothetical protein NQ318_004540 [Aromia moschata]|uniref:HAT C-terminal dimerisation domain-containing protein n=1 Tax=Aromia moschata TaxID=1265417 RepID=A0AAV8XRT7_9CUCU|nr:hypothetical protein NQ318_004540 [Aromia moschata]